MRYFVIAAAVLGLAGPAAAGHLSGESPGQVVKDGGVDRDGDGVVSAKDYAPGQSSKINPVEDPNGDGTTNGKDFAPGQLRK